MAGSGLTQIPDRKVVLLPGAEQLAGGRRERAFGVPALANAVIPFISSHQESALLPSPRIKYLVHEST